MSAAMNLLRAISRRRLETSNHSKDPRPLITPALAKLPMDILLEILDYLDPPCRYRVRLTCRHLYRTIDLDFRSLNKCEKWLVAVSLEKDLGADEMPKKLVCNFCKCRRPVRDFGYKKPWVGQNAFRMLRRIPIASKILGRFPSLHCFNWYSIEMHAEPQAFNDSPEGRCCYRHSDLWYTPLPKGSGKTVPEVEERQFRNATHDRARYAGIRVLNCGHCGRLMEDDDMRMYGCKHCNCSICIVTSRLQLFRAGEGACEQRPVEYLALRLGSKSREFYINPMERGSVFPCVQFPPPQKINRTANLVNREKVVGSCRERLA